MHETMTLHRPDLGQCLGPGPDDTDFFGHAPLTPVVVELLCCAFGHHSSKQKSGNSLAIGNLQGKGAQLQDRLLKPPVHPQSGSVLRGTEYSSTLAAACLCLRKP